MLDLVMSDFFGQPAPHPRVAPPSRPSTSSHPCDAEVTKCTRELNTGKPVTRDAIQQCLVAHYAQLSSGCKCFLHQTMGEELEKSAAAAKSSADPRVPAVAISEGRLTGTLVLEESPPPFAVEYAYPQPGHHRFTCALFIMVRRVVTLCCATPKPRFAAVVPPQQRVQLSVEPLVAAKITTTKM